MLASWLATLDVGAHCNLFDLSNFHLTPLPLPNPALEPREVLCIVFFVVLSPESLDGEQWAIQSAQFHYVTMLH